MRRAAALSLCLAAAARPATVASQQSIAITNVTVIDVETGVRRGDQTVVIAGRRITMVGPALTTHAPAGARVIDGSGKFVIPGLWDMHVHSAAAADRDLPTYVSFGITGVRNMHTTVDTALRLVANLKRAVASRDILGPRFIANGPIVDGPRPIHAGSVPVATPDAARRVVDSLAKGGADFIKVYNLLPRDAFFALMARAKEIGIPVDGHIPRDVGLDEASDAGMRGVEHLAGLPQACSRVPEAARASAADPTPPERARAIAALIAAPDTARCARAVATLRRNGTWMTPTLALHAVPAMADSIMRDAALMALVPAESRARWERLPLASPQFDRTRPRAFLAWAFGAVRLLHEGGVQLLAGTDVGNPFLFPGASLHRELELFVQAGLTPHDALRSATLNPARFLNATDSLGTVAPGKLADLVLLDADPLTDIRNTRRITLVVLDGRVVETRRR